MTRDEFMDLVYSELHSDGDNNRANRIIDAADSYAEDCELHWIPCSERMPEDKARVIVTAVSPYDGPQVFEATYLDGQWTRNGMILIKPHWGVVAWWPMPKPCFERVLCGWAFEEEWEKQNGSEVQ